MSDAKKSVPVLSVLPNLTRIDSKPVSGRKRKVEEDCQVQTVVRGINKVITDREVVKKINEDVDEISRLMYEFSLSFFDDMNEELKSGRIFTSKIKFLPYFYQLTKKPVNKPEYKLRADYAKLRGEKCPKYDISYRSNLMVSAGPMVL